MMMITATMACRMVKKPSPNTAEAATVRPSAHDATRLEAAGPPRVSVDWGVRSGASGGYPGAQITALVLNPHALLPSASGDDRWGFDQRCLRSACQASTSCERHTSADMSDKAPATPDAR